MPEFTASALIASMREATESVKDRMRLVIEAASSGLERDHQRAMPRSRTGPTAGVALADRVVVRRLHDWLHIVQSTSPVLHLVEEGTEDRGDRTTRTPPFRGRMPRLGPIFIPLAIARRTEMLRAGEDLIGDREL